MCYIICSQLTFMFFNFKCSHLYIDLYKVEQIDTHVLQGIIHVGCGLSRRMTCKTCMSTYSLLDDLSIYYAHPKLENTISTKTKLKKTHLYILCLYKTIKKSIH